MLFAIKINIACWYKLLVNFSWLISYEYLYMADYFRQLNLQRPFPS